MLQFPARALKIPPTVFCLSCWKRLWNRRRSCTGCPSPHTNVLDTDAPEQNKQTKPLSFWVTCLLSKATGHKCSPLPVLRDGKLRVSSAESILPLKYGYYEYQWHGAGLAPPGSFSPSLITPGGKNLGQQIMNFTTSISSSSWWHRDHQGVPFGWAFKQII